jgi:hypothetical protein
VFTYVVSGLQVSSDLALPGLIPSPNPHGAADVAIRAGNVPPALEDGGIRGLNWQMAGDRFLLTIPGILRMLLTGGREIRYQAEGDAELRDAAIFVSGTGFGILLHQRGRIVLHASAVQVRDSAVLFCGPSGAGKSTLAAALVDRGHALLSDDLCAISMTPGGRPLVQADGRQLKLWDNAIDRLALTERRADPVRGRLRKFYVEPRVATAAPLTPAAIYMLREARPPHPPGIVRPSLVDGATMMRGNAYRPSLVRRMDQKDLYFRAAVAIAREAGLFTLTRAMNFADMPAVIGWLEAHWRETGLLERAA